MKVVLVAITPTTSGYHIGIVHGDENDTHLTHLAYHEDLRQEEFDPDSDRYLTITVSDLNPYTRRQIHALCNNAYQKSPDLPYAHTDPFGAIDGAGHFNEDDKIGLTCATFVLAIFDQVQINLIDINDWDLATPQEKREIVKLVEQVCRNDPEHLNQALQAQVKRVFRPLPVAGAAREYPPPVSSQEAHEAATEIESQLHN